MENTTILELLLKPPNADVSLIAITYEVGPQQTFHCKDGVTRTNKNVVLVDDTSKAVSLTLWGDNVDKLNNTEGTSVRIDNIQTRDYNGKRILSTTSSTAIHTMDENATSEQIQLHQWWTSEGTENEYEELVLNSHAGDNKTE